MKAISCELYLLFSGQLDSWFYDSPLSPYGISQIEKLSSFLSKPPATSDETKIINVLNKADGASKTSVLVSSNLRRAISTVAIAFKERIANDADEKIFITGTLQEISESPAVAHRSVTRKAFVRAFIHSLL